MGFFEEWNHLLEPARVLVFHPQVRNGLECLRVVPPELLLPKRSRLLEQGDRLVELPHRPIGRGKPFLARRLVPRQRDWEKPIQWLLPPT